MGSQSLSFDERLRLAALMLRMAAAEAEGIHRSELEKLTIQKDPKQSATHSKFEGCFAFLVRNGFLVKVNLGIYKITPKGKAFLEAINE